MVAMQQNAFSLDRGEGVCFDPRGAESAVVLSMELTMLVDAVLWLAAVASGAVLRSAIPRRDIAQAGGAFGLLCLSFQYQFGAELSSTTKMAVAAFLSLVIVAWWRLARPATRVA